MRLNRATAALSAVLVAAALAAGCVTNRASTPPPATSTSSAAPPTTMTTTTMTTTTMTTTTMTTTTSTPLPPPDPAVAWLERVCTELQAIPIGVAPPAPPGNTLEDLKREGVNLVNTVREPLAALVTNLNQIGPPPAPALRAAYADLRRPLDGLLNRFNTLVADLSATRPGEPLPTLPDLGTLATNAWGTARQAVHIDPSLRPIAAQTTSC